MDNDLCIIYEKGLKPIKANKYYYFKYPEGKLVTRYKSNHNDVNVERGVWRKYNPYNPYVEETETNSGARGEVQSSLDDLDSLFEDDETTDNLNKPNNDNKYSFNTIDNRKEENNTAKSMSMPMETNDDLEAKRQAELLDIQKELEAKFDELFGTSDNDG